MRRALVSGSLVAALAVALTGPTPAASQLRPLASSVLPATCTTTVPVGRILTIGDSISASGAWQQQMASRLDGACATYEIYNASQGGYGSNEAIASTPLLMAAVRPQLVIYAMEINDDPSGFRARYQSAIDKLRQWGPSGMKIITTFAQRQTSPPAAAWINTAAKDNDVYAVSFANGGFTSQVVGFASFNQIPHTSTYQTSDGIHPTAAGLVKMGDMAYRGLYTWGAYPLPALPADPDLCNGACP